MVLRIGYRGKRVGDLLAVGCIHTCINHDPFRNPFAVYAMLVSSETNSSGPF